MIPEIGYASQILLAKSIQVSPLLILREHTVHATVSQRNAQGNGRNAQGKAQMHRERPEMHRERPKTHRERPEMHRERPEITGNGLQTYKYGLLCTRT